MKSRLAVKRKLSKLKKDAWLLDGDYFDGKRYALEWVLDENT